MASITFDTMKFVDTLREAGVPEAQAKAEAKAVNEAINTATDMSLSTKSDVQAVSMAVRDLTLKTDAEFKNIRLLMGIIAAGVGAILLKLFLPH
jgi:hypothetical protein